jgi:hypothetical protein
LIAAQVSLKGALQQRRKTGEKKDGRQKTGDGFFCRSDLFVEMAEDKME